MQFKQSICAIFTPNLEKVAPTTTVTNTIHLLEPLSKELFVITSNLPENTISSEKVHIIDIGIKLKANTQLPILISILRFIVIQFGISYSLAKIASKVDIVFLAAGAQAFFLPALLAKLMRKRLILSHLGLSGTSQKGYQILYDKTLFGIGKHIFPWLVGLLEGFNCRLSDRIITFLPSSSSLLEKYSDKVLFSSRFYVDTTIFKAEQNPSSRQNIVGYIGRFERIKGVMNFIKAIPLVLRESTASFLIGGDCSLKDEISKQVKSADWSNKVVLTGWIPYDELPQYLNKLKLLVIPSYGEIGPQILFEAMACGTPVLATPVGIIPDVIKEGETGFIMEDNSPECIAQNVTRALNHPNLDKIARNARELIEREYTHEAAVDRYRSILASLR